MSDHPDHTVQTIVAFDFGHRRIGVAVGQTLTGTATALNTLSSGTRGPSWQEIDKLFREWRPDVFVLGLALPRENESRSPLVRATRDFGEALHERFDRPVVYVDERLTSHAADQEIRDSVADTRTVTARHVRSRDSVAARLILQSYLNDGKTID